MGLRDAMYLLENQGMTGKASRQGCSRFVNLFSPEQSWKRDSALSSNSVNEIYSAIFFTKTGIEGA
jgi:hypothetical protein